MKYKDKVVVITGGANGIGKGLVNYFLKEGAYVASIDKEVMDKQENLLVMQGDIGDKATLETFVSKVHALYSYIDIVIHNACYSNQGLLSSCSYEKFNEVLHVGVSAPYYLTSLCVPYLNEEASIINIASTRAFQSQADSESYSATKGAIVALTHSMSVSLRGKARVNCISPGWIDMIDYPATESDAQQHTVNRVGKVEDIVEAISFLCSKEASFINGQNIIVDGGMSTQMIYHGDEGWSYTPKK